MAADIYTIGGGEIIYEVLRAVSLCLNGGGGMLHALITIGIVSGSVAVYYMFLAGNIEYILKKWALPLSAMLSFMFVPTTTVWVHDDISQFHRKLDNVLLGLGQFASHITTMSKALTGLVEQGFSLPDDLKYHKAGIVFGSDILEKAREFKIVNQNFRENMKNFVGQCVKYDIMLNNKYTFDDLRDSADLWGLVTSNPSKARGIMWLPIKGGKAQYISCAGAVEKFNLEWANELNRVAFSLSKKMFSGRAVGHSSLQGNKLVMTPPLANFLKNEFMANLQSTYSYLGELAYTAEEALKQNVMINAIGDAASENSRSAGNPVSYAEMKALLQQNYTFDTVGRLAAKVLPIMKAIIEALVYACFILIIPLCMIPSGYRFLINWAGTLIWVNAWPMAYAFLNAIMNFSARAATVAEIGTSGGITIANVNGVAAANSEIKVMAGYLALSVPFICIALVKGVGSFIHMASQMTGATNAAAGSAAGEIASGNLSVANVSLGNSQMGNVSNLQRNMNSMIGSGGHRLDTGGVMITNDAKGWSTSTYAQDSGPSNLASSLANVSAQQESIRNMKSGQFAKTVRSSELKSSLYSQEGRIYDQVSRMTSDDVAHQFNTNSQEGKNLSESFKYVDAKNQGKSYSSGTGAQGSLGLSGSIGGSLGFSKTGHGETDESESVLKGIQASASISGGVGTNVSASNSNIYGSQEQSVEGQDFSAMKASYENVMSQVSKSERNDELSGIGRERSFSRQIADNLTEDQSVTKNMIDQMEDSLQSSRSNSFTESENLTRSFVARAMEKNPDITENQAKEMLLRGGGDNQFRQSVINDVRSGNAEGFDTGSLRRPDIKESKFNYNGKDLKDSYEKKEQITQGKIADASEMIAQGKSDGQIRRGEISAKVNEKMDSVESDISKTKEEIQNKNTKIKDALKERSKDGAVWSAGKELWNSVAGDEDDE